MAEHVDVWRLDGLRVMVGLDSVEPYLCGQYFFRLPDGEVAYDEEALTIIADLEQKLTGERTALCDFQGSMVRAGRLYRELKLDLWFIEVTKSVFSSKTPGYVELTKDEASDWLKANLYTRRDSSPGPERFDALVRAARGFTRACRDHADHRERNPPDDWPPIYRLIHEKAKKVNIALGGRHGEQSLRRPVGWDLSVGQSVRRLAAAFEEIVGAGEGAWDLRSPENPSALIDLPEEWSDDPGILGAIRLRPFSFGPSVLASLKEMEEATAALEKACRLGLFAREGHLVDVLEPSKLENQAVATADVGSTPPDGLGRAVDSERKSPAVAKKGARTRRQNPASRVIAAAHELAKEGSKVSIAAACERASADRHHFANKYPEEAEIVRKMGHRCRDLRRGMIDRRSRTIDAVDESEE